MYGTIRHEIRIERPAGQVWELAGNASRLHEWFPGIIECTVDGNQRTIVTATGIPMPEEILACDDTQRRFQYRIVTPIFKHHRGTIDVIDLGDETCLVVYSTEADPRTMAMVIGGGTAAALQELKRQIEGATRQMKGTG
ncbi:MAG: SRPBCC family protein [Actinobacteria bacterium]|nr:SRPBCC family protein [Actinomycetota bacterium]